MSDTKESKSIGQRIFKVLFGDGPQCTDQNIPEETGREIESAAFSEDSPCENWAEQKGFIKGAEFMYHKLNDKP